MTDSKTADLAREAYENGLNLVLPQSWQIAYLERLARDLKAAADTGSELSDERLKDCRDFLGVLVGR